MHGSQRLAAWRKKTGRSQTECAATLGVRQPTWSEWEAGRKNPQIVHAVAIEKLSTDPETGAPDVPVNSWVEAVSAVEHEVPAAATGTEGV